MCVRARPAHWHVLQAERMDVPADAPPEPRAALLALHHAAHLDDVHYRFEKGTRLRLVPGASLLGRRVYVYTNYAPPGAEWARAQYAALEWRRADGEPAPALLTDTDVCCELLLERAGSFHYYFVYDSPEARVSPQGSGWFAVSPSLSAGGRALPLDALACQTVLAKCLGPLPRWPRALLPARLAGYNALHFTPVQRLGASRSSYSIADQLRLDPRLDDPAAGRPASFADLRAVLDQLRERLQVLTVCDVVLNHTANETPWLAEHPEATYNCLDCPHLRPAALLDAALYRFTLRVAAGAVDAVPARLCEPAHLDAARRALEPELAALGLADMFTCDAAALETRFVESARERVPAPEPAGDGELRLVADPLRRRRAATVDIEAALRLYNVHRADCDDEERVRRNAAAFRARLERLNEAAAGELEGHLRAALDNCFAGARYERLQADGPRYAEVSARRPLFARYFTLPEEAERDAAAAEAAVYGEAGRRVMAHNGWVMGAEPLDDFAAREAGGRVYLRRELVAWGDSVKLRYGAREEDSPWLWAHMREYVRRTAAAFDGLRLDNCHSTPLHVAEHMVDAARAERPELFVLAELFTDSDRVDNVYVNRLGITSLVREAQSAGDARELGRLVYRYGGRPVGAFLPAPGRAASPAVAHAMLLDQTHDNPSPLATRSLFDLLPTAALVAMACCATGSTRGYDELVPHAVHVVDEERLYAAGAEEGAEEAGGEAAGEEEEVRVGAADGLVAARRALNALHKQLAADGYTEVFVDQMDEDVVAVTRHHPLSRKSVVLVAHTAFRAPPPDAAPRRPRALRFEGRLADIALEAWLTSARGRPYEPPRAPAPHPRYLAGLRDYELHLRRDLPLERSEVFAGARLDGAATVLEWRGLPPGGVVALRVAPDGPPAAALASLARTLREVEAGAPDPLRLAAPLAALQLPDFNTLLYCCEAEERERCGGGAYEVPGHGALVYAGLQGPASLLEEVARADDLGHPVCANLRAGDWLLEYQWRRLEGAARLAAVAARYREALSPVAALPRFLVPAYFEAVLRALLAAVRAAALARMRLPLASPFAEELALTSVQLTAEVESARLPALSAALAGSVAGVSEQQAAAAARASLSAGLPHFATGYMRCWGRDTFIALRGLYLLTGRYADARAHLLAFAGCLRHGLVPNLLDGGGRARYNCRDAVWWWLLAVQHYCRDAPQGPALLAEPVARLFPADDADGRAPQDQPLHDVIQEALDRHFQGVVFRERDAGRRIDAHMTDRGFNVQLGVDPETGFPFGGNDANCGTWMDKMGSSERAGTRGRPATPRDGSAVELVALAYSAAAWLAAQHRAARYPYPGVARRHRDGALTAWTYAQWAERIRRSFERHFWVPAAPAAADARPDLVHRRAIYKDVHGASQPWADYQLRCNFVVAMAVAPDLFDPKRAWLALDNVERLLLGPLGLKTLDPADWAYRGDYDNSDDGPDPSVAHGFNYHQGPEWLWPMGFYLRARLAFAADNGAHARTVAAVYATLGAHVAELRASPWRGLPELTNAGGAYCRDSCRSQAWSSACVLEALHDAECARRARPLPLD